MIPLGNVLVIDDEQASFEMYRDTLTPDGYRVEWAATRKAALDKLQQPTWDVVILDQRLEGAAGGDSGIDLLAEIIPTGAKVIVATGYADRAMIERAFRDGAYDYLEKNPLLPTLLRVKVRNAAEAVRERRIAALVPEAREAAIREQWSAVKSEADSNRKGKLLEDLMALLFKTVPGFEHVDTRRKGKDEEIDLIVRNESTDPFWVKEQSQYVLVECKNWSKPVDYNEIVVFRDKMELRAGRCRLGFFVAASGFTEGVLSRMLTERKNEILVVPIGPQNIEELVGAEDRNAVLKKLHGRAVMAGNGHNGHG